MHVAMKQHCMVQSCYTNAYLDINAHQFGNSQWAVHNLMAIHQGMGIFGSMVTFSGQFCIKYSLVIKVITS